MAYKRLRDAAIAGGMRMAAGYLSKRYRSTRSLAVKRRKRPATRSRYLKRRRTRSATVTRRRRTRETYQPTAEYTKSNVTLGRPRRSNLEVHGNCLSQTRIASSTQ